MASDMLECNSIIEVALQIEKFRNCIEEGGGKRKARERKLKAKRGKGRNMHSARHTTARYDQVKYPPALSSALLLASLPLN
jgi:hypothetical protein